MKPEVFVWECLACGGLNRTPLPSDGSEVVLICTHCGQRVDDEAARRIYRGSSA